MRKLENMCEESERASLKLCTPDIMVHTAKHLDSDSELFTEDGRHLFSLCSVMSPDAMQHIFHVAKHSRQSGFLHSIDNAMYSPYHYAAMHNLHQVFDHVTQCHFKLKAQSNIDHTTVKALCLYHHPDTKQSVPSILIEQDKMSTLATCMNEALGIQPFDSEFEDTYLSWLHESVLSNARSTANYLQRCHGNSMKLSLQRSRWSYPIEHTSPLDILLSSDHKNQAYYTDVILSDIDGSYKLICTTPEMVMCGGWIANMTTDDRLDFIEKCMTDTILFNLSL